MNFGKKITLVPRVGTIFYCKESNGITILSKIVNNNKFIICDLITRPSFTRGCYTYYINEIKNLEVIGFDEALVPQVATVDNIKTNDPLIGNYGLMFVMGVDKIARHVTLVDTGGFIYVNCIDDIITFKLDDVINSRILRNILDYTSRLAMEKRWKIKMTTEEAYNLYRSTFLNYSAYECNRLGVASLHNACKIQQKKNNIFQGKFDVSTLNFTRMLKTLKYT